MFILNLWNLNLTFRNFLQILDQGLIQFNSQFLEIVATRIRSLELHEHPDFTVKFRKWINWLRFHIEIRHVGQPQHQLQSPWYGVHTNPHGMGSIPHVKQDVTCLRCFIPMYFFLTQMYLLYDFSFMISDLIPFINNFQRLPDLGEFHFPT